MSDRIKLAEAMGWTNSHQFRWDGPGDGEYRNDPPDPFTDANDDYAVLEWFRQRAEKYKELGKPYPESLWQMSEQMNKGTRLTYQIGDYARAAALVLDRREPN